MCRQHYMMLKRKLEVVSRCWRCCMLIIVYYSALKVQFNYLLCQAIFWLTWTLILYIWCFSHCDKTALRYATLPTVSGNNRKNICKATVSHIKYRKEPPPGPLLFSLHRGQKNPQTFLKGHSIKTKSLVCIYGYGAWNYICLLDFFMHCL